jgi:choline dehydrogenase-like flavoprotein
VGKVVDPDYKVLDVDKLRVVDGSTFTESPGTNPQATVMMMGRYAYMNHIHNTNKHVLRKKSKVKYIFSPYKNYVLLF